MQGLVRYDCGASRMRARAAILLSALIYCALLAGPAQAQRGKSKGQDSSGEHSSARDSSSSQAAAKPSEYDRLLKEALSEFDLGNWTEARALFERAHEIKPSARTLRAIGLSAFEEKSYAASVVALTAALKDARSPLSAQQRADAERALERAYNYVAQYELAVTPEDAQATVSIDAREPVMLEGRLLLDPGRYLLEVTAEGYEVARREVVARPHEKLKLRIELARPEQGAVAQPAVTAATPESESAPAESGLSTQQWIGVGVGAAGVATLGVSAAFGLTAMSKADDAGCKEGLCADQSSQKLNQEALDAGTISTVTFVVGAVALAAGAVLFFVPLSSEDSGERVALQPVISPEHAGVRLGGRW